MTILILNGPNLNLLGTREPTTYGAQTLDDINLVLDVLARELGAELKHLQSNHEGVLLDTLHARDFDAVVLNAGAFTHTSYALRDAIAAIEKPVIEVHISNVHQREKWRHHSVISEVCAGIIVGFGPLGYELGLRAAVTILKKENR